MNPTMTRLSICDFGPPPTVPARFNLAAHTLAQADVTPHKVALTVARSGADEAPERLTYGDIRDRVFAAAGGLAALGVKAGERIVLRIGHSTDFPILYLGAAALGAVPVPTSTLLSAEEVAYIIADTGARLLVASSGLAVAGVGVKTLTPGELAGEPIGDFADTGADDLAYIIYTSGSSGHPKGVAHAHRAAFARRMMWRGWYGLGADDLILHAGAFNWTYTLGTGVLDPWAAGAASLIYAGPRDPSVWPRLIETFGATIFAAAPGVYRQLLKSDADLSGLTSLRHGLSAGEAMADSVERAWVERTGKPVYEALGMTECSTFLSSSPDNPGRAGHAGRPQQGRRVALLPLDGGDTPVPLGEAGVISIHRSDPGLMKGYWNLANETAEALRGDWFLTGDLGVMDADGYVRYEGRSDDQMNAQGYRVAPQEVEAALMQHPAITGAAAVALPVRDDLSLIAAFLTVDGEVPTDDDLARHCAEHLAAYKIPKIFRVLDELPHTPNGKLMRKALVRAERGKG